MNPDAIDAMRRFAGHAIHWAWSWPQGTPHLWLVDRCKEVPWSEENVRFCELLSHIDEVDHIPDRILRDILNSAYAVYFNALLNVDLTVSPAYRGGCDFDMSAR